MSIWRVGAFDNDDAADWVRDLHDHPTLSYIERALDAVSDTKSNYIQVTEGANAIAAAETVARLQGHFGSSNVADRRLDEWIAGLTLKPSASIAHKAK